MCTIFHHDLCPVAELKVKGEGRAREGDEKGRCEERAWSAARLAGEKRASHEVHAFESDWDSDCGLVTHSLFGGWGGDATRTVARERGRGGTTVVSMDAEKSARASGERVVFFQSSNLLNLFFPRNVAAVSKLLIAIGKVEPMGGEPNWAGKEGTGGWLERGQAGTKRGGVRGQDVSIYREDRYEQHCRSFRSVSFRFASSPFRYVTLRLLGRASPRAI